MSIIVETPFQNFTGLDGKPLTNGKVYIGQVGTDPTVLANQIPVFWDEALTIPASQPLTTNAGYIVRTGTPSRVYAATNYSISVKNASYALVYYVSENGTANFATLSQLAASAGSSLIGWIQSGIGAVYRNVRDKLRENVSALDFGAVNDGLQTSGATNRIAIQAAIDAMNIRGGGVVNIGGGGVYYVDVVNYFKGDGTLSGITSIKLKNNVSIKIEDGTTIRLANSQYGAGAFYRMFSSQDGSGTQTMLTNGRIYGGGTVDGNKNNQTASDQCSNIQLECLKNVVVEEINCINSNGIGIMLRGSNVSLGEKLRISNCNVSDCTNIGIQSSSFTGLVISNNNVTNCANNAIDVYGNRNTDVEAYSYNFSIVGNVINNCLVGIFLETVRLGVVTGNSVTLAFIGTIVNRINGEPRGLIISSNTFLSCPVGGQFTGDTKGVAVKGNTFDQFSTAGVALGGGVGGSVSYIDVSDNTFVPTSNAVSIISIGGATASFISGRQNTIIIASANEAFFNTKLAPTVLTNVTIGGFKVFPFQVGPDLYGEFTQSPIIQVTSPSNQITNASGPATVIIPDKTCGEVWVDGFQGGVGRARRVIEYRNVNGILTLFTQTDKSVVSATPFTAATSVGGNVQINFVAGANNYASWGIICSKVVA